MALTVEELQIVLSCDATTAQTVLKQMEATVKAYTDKFQSYFDKLGTDKSPKTIVGDVKAVEKQLDNVTKAIESKGKDWKAAYAKTWGETYEQSIAKAYKNTGEYIPSGQRFIPSESWDRYERMQRQQNADTDLGFGTRFRDTVSPVLESIRAKASSVFSSIGPKAEAVARHIGEVFQYLPSIIGGAFSKAFSVATGLIGGVKNVLSGIVGVARRVGRSIKKAFNHTLLGRFLQRLRMTTMRMAAMALIRGVINGTKQGLQELAKVSESSAKAMNTIKAASGSIKMALGAALMPVVKALAPVFVSLAGAISSAANAIARFFAVVTGQATYTAVNFGGSLDNIASSAGGAGKAVKGMLAAFDELVVIGNKSGGGGGGGGGVEQSLSTVADLTAVSELGTRIREAIERGDWREVGVAVAEKFNSAIGDWDAAGSAKKISEKVKNALDTAIGFAETFDARLLGEKIREWFTNVDWAGITSRVFELFGAIIGGIGSFLAGLFVPEGELTLEGFLTGLGNAIKNIGTWIVDNIFTPFINGFKKAFGIASPAKEMEGPGEMVGEGILVGISNALNRVEEIFNAFKDIISASLGIAGEYVGAFFETLIDFIAARGEIISGNVQRFILNIKASVLEGLAGLVDNLANGPMGRLLNLIGVDLAGAAETLRGKAADARDAIGEIDDKIADAQERASSGFDISAHVDATKVDALKTKIDNAKSAIGGTSSKVGELNGKLDELNGKNVNATVTVKVNTRGGTSTSSSGVTVSRPSVNINLDHLAVGGLAFGPTPALVGEYAGARSNPEVVAPLSDLVGILAKVGAPQGGTSEEEMRLLREQNTLLRQIAQKELKLSPSTQLGQVVERSRQLYART